MTRRIVHRSMTRGESLSFSETSRDEFNRARDLTDARIYVDVRADAKIAPSVRLCSESPAPSGYRVGVEIPDQDQYPGRYTVELAQEDTEDLVALGHDDPWLYSVRIVMAENKVVASSVTRVGSTVTVVTATPHVFSVGDSVYVSGADQLEYDGRHTVATVADDTHLTFEIATTPASPATGTIGVDGGGPTIEDVATSNLDIYPQVTDTP